MSDKDKCMGCCTCDFAPETCKDLLQLGSINLENELVKIMRTELEIQRIQHQLGKNKKNIT